MPVAVRPFLRFPVQCAVTYKLGPFQGHGTVWNLSCTGWCLSGDLPMRPGETLSLTVTLPNEQRIEVTEAVAVVERAGVCGGEPCDRTTHCHVQLGAKSLN
jgi:hypothetical protein